MSEDFAAIAAEVEAAVFDAIGLTAIVRRHSGADESTYPPTPGTSTDYTCTAVEGKISDSDKATNSSIGEKDVMIQLFPPLSDLAGNTTSPAQTDVIVLTGYPTLHIQNVEITQKGGVVIKWDCRARAGE